MDMRPIHDVALRADYATVVRLGRVGRGWTQTQLGQRANLSRTVVSRFETGDRPLRDVDLRRRLADALDVPIEMFGLSSTSGPKVSDTRTEGDDEVRRRAFLVAAGAAVLSVEQSFAHADPSARRSVGSLIQRMEQALIHPERGMVRDPAMLPGMLKAAQADFRGTRYRALADRLVTLVASAEAHVDQRPEPEAHRLLAEVYLASAHLLHKLPASGLEWIAIDHARRAARMSDDPLLTSEAQRLLSIAYRRVGRPDHALAICTDAADQLRSAGGPECGMRTAELLCTASYCAAKVRDRDRATELLRTARQFAERARVNGQDWTAFFGPVNVSVYAVSVGTELRDPSISFNAIKAVNLAELASTERRSRFLVDAATARLAADQPEQATRTLLIAARIAPQEIANRPAAVALAGTLRKVRPDLGSSLREAGL